MNQIGHFKVCGVSLGAHVLGDMCLGDKCPGGKCPGYICPWGKCPGVRACWGGCVLVPERLLWNKLNKGRHDQIPWSA